MDRSRLLPATVVDRYEQVLVGDLVGRSLRKNMNIARSIGYVEVPEDILVKPAELSELRRALDKAADKGWGNMNQQHYVKLRPGAKRASRWCPSAG